MAAMEVQFDGRLVESIQGVSLGSKALFVSDKGELFDIHLAYEASLDQSPITGTGTEAMVWLRELQELQNLVHHLTLDNSSSLQNSLVQKWNGCLKNKDWNLAKKLEVGVSRCLTALITLVTIND